MNINDFNVGDLVKLKRNLFDYPLYERFGIIIHKEKFMTLTIKWLNKESFGHVTKNIDNDLVKI